MQSSLAQFNSHSLEVKVQAPTRGRIELILGPMFAGKSTELLRRLKRLEISGKKCVTIKYINDDRYSADNISTHDRQERQALACKNLNDIKEMILQHEVIGIDEGQFFSDIVEFSESAANQGKILIISALDGTFQRKAFGSILDLVPIAEKVKKLGAICKICSEKASFTFRTVLCNDIELIGGENLYIPLCRHCFQVESKKQEQLLAL